MTPVFVIGLCIAGFVLGFLALYSVRRQHHATRGLRPKPSVKEEPAKKEEMVPCPWCGNRDYSPANPSFACPECGTVHHRSCWKEHGGCSIFDCRLAPTAEEAKETV